MKECNPFLPNVKRYGSGCLLCHRALQREASATELLTKREQHTSGESVILDACDLRKNLNHCLGLAQKTNVRYGQILWHSRTPQDLHSTRFGV